MIDDLDISEASSPSSWSPFFFRAFSPLCNFKVACGTLRFASTINSEALLLGYTDGYGALGREHVRGCSETFPCLAPKMSCSMKLINGPWRRIRWRKVDPGPKSISGIRIHIPPTLEPNHAVPVS
ncbi:hypothetical protein EUGRSUZ_F03299 [Eucalyptus grandis]|uniref:Uncharacterized protein n=2 Tax=Eucalyptus grandis TaxID=71139 RepID=A0ACC3KKY9_EUCGR|nr:hypothetical protein EUGRSUZ_F03299 [Eucalyptus grandis]